MNCKLCEEYLIPYLYEELDAGDKAQMDRHLADSPACAETLQSLRSARDLVAQEEEAEPPAALHTRILAHAAEHQEERRRRWNWARLLRPAITTAVVAVVASIVYFKTAPRVQEPGEFLQAAARKQAHEVEHHEEPAFGFAGSEQSRLPGETAPRASQPATKQDEVLPAAREGGTGLALLDKDAGASSQREGPEREKALQGEQRSDPSRSRLAETAPAGITRESTENEEAPGWPSPLAQQRPTQEPLAGSALTGSFREEAQSVEAPPAQPGSEQDRIARDAMTAAASSREVREGKEPSSSFAGQPSASGALSKGKMAEAGAPAVDSVQPSILPARPGADGGPVPAEVTASRRLSRSGRCEEALTRVQNYADRNPNDQAVGTAWLDLAHCFRSKGNLQQAREMARRAAALPGSAQAARQFLSSFEAPDQEK